MFARKIRKNDSKAKILQPQQQNAQKALLEAKPHLGPTPSCVPLIIHSLRSFITRCLTPLGWTSTFFFIHYVHSKETVSTQRGKTFVNYTVVLYRSLRSLVESSGLRSFTTFTHYVSPDKRQPRVRTNRSTHFVRSTQYPRSSTYTGLQRKGTKERFQPWPANSVGPTSLIGCGLAFSAPKWFRWHFFLGPASMLAR